MNNVVDKTSYEFNEFDTTVGSIVPNSAATVVESKVQKSGSLTMVALSVTFDAAKTLGQQLGQITGVSLPSSSIYIPCVMVGNNQDLINGICIMNSTGYISVVQADTTFTAVRVSFIY